MLSCDVSRKFGFHRRRLEIIYVFGKVHRCACKALARCHVYNIVPWHHSETCPAGELLEFPLRNFCNLTRSISREFSKFLMHFWKQFSLGQNFSPKTKPKTKHTTNIREFQASINEKFQLQFCLLICFQFIFLSSYFACHRHRVQNKKIFSIFFWFRNHHLIQMLVCKKRNAIKKAKRINKCNKNVWILQLISFHLWKRFRSSAKRQEKC